MAKDRKVATNAKGAAGKAAAELKRVRKEQRRLTKVVAAMNQRFIDADNEPDEPQADPPALADLKQAAFTYRTVRGKDAGKVIDAWWRINPAAKDDLHDLIGRGLNLWQALRDQCETACEYAEQH